MGAIHPLPVTGHRDLPLHDRDGGDIGVDSTWPSHSNELARKALDTLHAAIFDYSEGVIGDRELRIIVDTLVDTVMGLVPMEVIETIYAVRKDLE